VSIPEPQQRFFLSELERTRNVSAAARAAGIGRRQQLYVLRDRDIAFRKAWNEAMGREDADEEPEASGRIRFEDMTPKSRFLFRQFMASLDEPEELKPSDLAKVALDSWLSGKPWALLDEPVAAALLGLSRRAHSDYAAQVPTAP